MPKDPRGYTATPKPIYSERKQEGMEVTFSSELKSLLNRYSRENPSNTPDWVLAQYLEACLQSFNCAVQQRETWYGRDARPTIGERNP